jgi:hypothetical protein
MILPNKNIKIEYSLLGCGAMILKAIKNRDTVSSLWERVHTDKTIVNYEKFILTLDYLFAVGAIQIMDGIIERC